LAQLEVTNRTGASQPFLRGILTRSLQKAGLSFSDAYEIASRVRESLESFEDVSTEQVRSETASQLRSRYGLDVERGYSIAKRHPGWIQVRDSDGHAEWFSRNQHQRRLEICGLPQEVAEQLTQTIHNRLLKTHLSEINRGELRNHTVDVLRTEAGDEFAASYTAWHYFIRSGRPLIIMVGGTAGVGKSTVSAEISTRLNITRSQSTDMLREVMRTMVATQLMPELHQSSFEAWRALPNHHQFTEEVSRVIDGYHRQADLVEVAAEAVMQRAFREKVSLLLEGVHIRPSLVDKIPSETDAVAVQMMLGVLRKKQLQRQFRGRSSEAHDRRAQRYLDSFDAIWNLQTALLDEARAAGVPVLVNDNLDSALTRVMRTITAAVLADSEKIVALKKHKTT